MFKVLVIAYYFPPMGLSGVQRILKFVKYLPQNNWQPTILTSAETGYFAHDPELLKEVDQSVQIIRVKGNELNAKLSSLGTIKMPREKTRKLINRINQFLYIPDNKVSWAKKAIFEARKLLMNEQFDLIFVTAPPFSAFQIGAQLKKEFKIPLAIDYRDLWYGYQFSKYLTPYHAYKHKKLEYGVLKEADKIFVTNRRIKEYQMETYKFLDSNDIVIVPHGYDPTDFEVAPVIKKKNNKMILTYTGSFYEFITPKYLLKAFALLKKEKREITDNIDLYFVGAQTKELRKLTVKYGLEDSVKEFGYLTHIESVAKIKSSDVLWLMVGNGKNGDTISSGKLFEYFGSRKPILACLPDGSLKSYAMQYGATYHVDPENVENIKGLLLKIYDDYKTKSFPIPNEEFIEKFRRDFLTEQLAKELQFMVKNN
ncbi:MAG: glycosyltransferase [Ignavibacteriaceae bacterium]|jgi:glycosyltransferase involved in cell wall biosynthesis|nr:glycosyltransferase [Ignavibacteriaceae bacterium]